jgi:IclR family pca regulon transcriptional regulator
VLNLGFSYLSSLPIWKMAQPVMRALVDELNEPCSLGVLEDGQVVYIARERPTHLLFSPINVGTRVPAHANAMGHVLLAGMPSEEFENYLKNASFEKFTKYTPGDVATLRKAIKNVNENSFSFSEQMMSLGQRSIAVPIISQKMRTEIAINCTISVSRASKREIISRVLPRLQNAARQLSLES